MRKFYLIFCLLILTSILKAQNLPYVNQTDVGLLFGDRDMKSFSIQSFNGILINNGKLNLGFVIGIDIYQPLILIPLAPSIKYLPFKSIKTNPYVCLTVGYAFSGLKKFDKNQDSDGGTFLYPSIGLRLKTQKKSALNLTIGYKKQKGSITTYTNASGVRFKNKLIDKYTFKRFSLTIGMSF